MAVNYKDITQLEELETLPDDAEILVVTDGKAKKISKGNAKFGCGSTVYTIDDGSGVSTVADSGPKILPLYNKDGTQPTAQEVYDAFMGGQVIVETLPTEFLKLDCIHVLCDSEDGVMTYVEIFSNSVSTRVQFSAGEAPSGN